MKDYIFYALYSIVLLTTFINDYFLFDRYPVFYMGWVAIILLRFVLKIPIRKKEIMIQLILFIAISPPFFNELLSGSEKYWHAYIFIVLSVNIILTFPYLLSNPRPLFIISMIWMLFFALGSIPSLMNSERALFVFGPNTLYRIYAFIFTSFSIASFQLKRFGVRNVLFTLTLLSYLVANAATLSRGATIVTTVVLLHLFLFNSKNYFKLVRNILIVLMILSGGLYAVENIASIQRLVSFDAVYRREFLLDSYQLVFTVGLFGLTSQNIFFPFPLYPHNIFAEAIIYSGWYFFFLLLTSYSFSLYKLVFVKSKAQTYHALLLLIGVLIGSLFSGSLFDNFLVFSLGITLLVLKLKV